MPDSQRYPLYLYWAKMIQISMFFYLKIVNFKLFFTNVGLKKNIGAGFGRECNE